MHTTLFAAALGARDGRVLVVEQAVNGQTRIGPPAAQVEQGESIVDAAIRQCRESSGYPFVPTALVGVYRWTGAAAGADYLYVALAGECQNSGEPVDPSVKAVRWLSLAELEATESIQHNPVALNSARDLLSGRRFPLDTLHDWDGTGAARNKRN
jgi:ADP-ribose pyrophosphatase YjhB (NUDIX family)